MSRVIKGLFTALLAVVVLASEGLSAEPTSARATKASVKPSPDRCPVCRKAVEPYRRPLEAAEIILKPCDPPKIGGVFCTETIEKPYGPLQRLTRCSNRRCNAAFWQDAK